jgi:DNA-binding MarR family transcriptional regulator
MTSRRTKGADAPLKPEPARPANAVIRPLEENLSYRLSFLHFQMGRATGPLLASHGVSNQQWKVLSVLHRIGPATAQEVTQWVTLDKSAISRTVRSLLQKAWLTRKLMGDDGRNVHLLLTARGRALYQRVATDIGTLQAELTQDLSDTARRSLFESLRRVEKRLRERDSTPG